MRASELVYTYIPGHRAYMYNATNIKAKWSTMKLTKEIPPHAFVKAADKDKRQLRSMMRFHLRKTFIFIAAVITVILTGVVLFYGHVDPARVYRYLPIDTKSNKEFLHSISNNIPSFVDSTSLRNKSSVGSVSSDHADGLFPQGDDSIILLSNNKSAILPLPTSADDIIDKTGGNLKVIILTRKRSGSSFVGEVLNQNPDMFYMYEPLTVLTFLGAQRFMRKQLFDVESLQILNATLRCDFRKLRPKWWYYLKKNMCLFSKSMENTEICGDDPNPQPDDANKYVEHEILFNLTRICQSYRYIGIKTIRLTDIELLKPLVTSSHLNIKILHLVRDPRGTMNSRMKLPQKNWEFLRHKGKTGDEVTDLCRSIYRNLKYINSNEDRSWLRNRYKLIRYEDTAIHPRKKAEEIYDFLGIPFPDSLNDWIESNTNANSVDPYSHTRDSKSIVHAWRQRLNVTHVLHMQDKCKKLMPLLGYNVVNSTQELVNTTFPLLESIPLSTISLL